MAARSLKPNPQQHFIFEPQCTHLTMARVYDPLLLCLACHRPGPNGWVYCCTQDREDMIEHAICRGEMMCFDALGQQLSGLLRMRKGSPAAREDRLSFFDEITSQQLSTHKPAQVANILRQRENVQAAIQIQRFRSNSAEIVGHPAFSAVTNHFDGKKPWVINSQDECQYRICPRCRPGAADRAFLSLNAIASGEIPPTVAVGYGFHILGERPVVNADIVINLGRRSGPIPSKHSPVPGTRVSQATLESREGICQLFETSISISPVTGVGSKSVNRRESLDPDSQISQSPGLLKHSPACGNLALYAGENSQAFEESASPLLWAPSPSLSKEESGCLTKV
ncbi:hypothetical protein CDD82_4511 [Ophiocordyceps australis]|uniref:Uncharacterized protein n=1 Tax=Ophiocordyceps australis TaxID=1399860 RepID=A0A2C5ZST6_9HYPO|nr:hypothetical protein CDD82_4511 [Ophiocordyceps australis]